MLSPKTGKREEEMRDEMGLEYTVKRLRKLETRLKDEEAELILRFLDYDDLSREDRAESCGSSGGGASGCVASWLEAPTRPPPLLG